MNYQLIDIPSVGKKSEGFLSFSEFGKEISFEVKRAYFIYEVPVDLLRGHHAHRDLNQMLFCVNGEILITVDDGYTQDEFLLHSPKQGLQIGPGVWHTMKFNREASALCVLASDYYNESDYIRNYDEFLRLVKDGYWK